MLEFLVRVKGQPERAVEVNDETVVAGSEAGLPIVIPGAAPRHFEISVRSVGVVLRALDPDVETRVNGAGTTQVRLSVGDVIEVGGAQVVFSRHGQGGSAEPARRPAAQQAQRPANVGPAVAAERAEPRPRPTRRKSGSLGPVAILLLLAVIAGGAVFLLNRDKGSDLPVTLLLPDGDEATGGKRAPEAGSIVADEGTRGPWLEPTAELDPEPSALPEPEPGGGEAQPTVDDIPDPAPASTLPGQDEVERRQREKLKAKARDKLAAFVQLLPERVSRYTFDGPIADLTGIADSLPLGSLRDEVEIRRKDLLAAQRAYVRAKTALSSEKRTRLTLASGLELVVTGADETGIDAKIGSATTRKRWTELRPLTLHSVAVDHKPTVSEWMDAAAFAALFGEQETAELDLIGAFSADEAYLADICAALARYRGIEPPAGGFVLHEEQWVTREEKGFIDQGLVKHDGRWMTKDEALTAQGYVQHEGRWLSPRDYERVQKEIAEAEALAKKFLPKGFIDQPGHGSDTPWKQATELKTRHYKVVTNLDRDTAKDIAYTMEVLRMNLASVFGLRGKGARFTVNVVANREQYRANWPRVKGSLGFCSNNEICTFYQPPMTTSVLMHEGTHQMVKRFASTCPRWMHEGLATYFECSKFDFDPKRKRVTLRVGLLNAQRLGSFQAQHQAGRTVPLETFLNGGGGNPYTQGWALVYYLAKGKDGQYGRRLHSYVKEVRQGACVEPFMKTFKVKDLKKFEKEWLEFILALNPADGVKLAGQHQ